MESYLWSEINDRLEKAIRPTARAVALKYIKRKEEIENVPNVKIWTKFATVCQIIGLSSYYKLTIALTSENTALWCGGIHGLKKREADWYGVTLSSDPTKWHADREGAAAHARASIADLPSDDHYAVISAPLASGDIAEPDAIVISIEPGAAFYLFAGLIEKDFREIGFIFRGESTCAETWCRTYASGKPGLSLGCRGDRCMGALAGNEVRLSISTADLLQALQGCERLAADTIEYPFYPIGYLDIKNL
jgi:uncharacterized protein (DUF169 family)